jgi:hypothetical protein
MRLPLDKIQVPHPVAKLILAHMVNNADCTTLEYEGSYSQSALAGECSRRYAITCHRWLEEHGFIKLIKKGGGSGASNRYAMLLDGAQLREHQEDIA